MPAWECPELWPGETCFIVAKGPSLIGFDFEQLRGKRVIACKEMWRAVPFAQFMIFCDYTWIPELDNMPSDFVGKVVTIAPQAPEWCFRLEEQSIYGITDRRSRLCGSRTVSHYALNLARHLIGPGGTIGLLGVDLQPGPNGETHSYGAHALRDGVFERQVKSLETAVEPLRERNINVFNCTPGGALELWPRRRVEDLL